MTIRLKVRILLLVSVSLTVFYIVSHVYRLNNWFAEKNIVNKVEEDDSSVKEYETAIHSISDHLQLNATKNTVKPSADHTKIKTFQPPHDDVSSEHKPYHHDGYVKNTSAENTPVQTESESDVHTKRIEDTTKSIQNAPKISPVIEEEIANDFPTNKASITYGIKTLPTMNVTSDGKMRSASPLTPDNLTDDQQDDLIESGDTEEAKTATDDKYLETVNVGEDEEIMKEEKNFKLPSIPKIPPTLLLTTVPPPPPSSLKIKFEGEPNSDNKTIEDDKSPKKEEVKHIGPAEADPLALPEESTPENDCLKQENIGEEKPKRKSQCNLYSTYVDTCAESAKYYTKENLASAMNCTEKKHSTICYFVNSTRTDHSSKLHLKCNYSICHKNEVRVGILNATSGKISYMFLNHLKTVVETLEQESRYDSKEHGADFIFLSCQLNNKKKQIHQILPFPPLVLKTRSRKRNLKDKRKNTDKFNINIVVLDSLSRKHFYRTLKKTAKAMKSMNKDISNKNIVLDFKGFQSLAPFTYVNLQALLTGSVDFESVTNRRYNFEDLFSLFRTTGYQTLLQEDTCWHDEWGSILTGNRKLEKQDPHYRKKVWDEIRNLTTHHGIDSFGLTHMSCDVLANFGVTNLYNSNAMVCLNGEPLSSYFLEHILDNILTRTITTDAMPLLSYTHINIAHESSGTRIIGLDKHLEHFISVLGMLSNTLTIFLSDHGGKTSEYFMDTLAGRFEVYDPFLFMMVPKKLADVVGSKNIQNLIDNQNSLLDVIDIRSMLLTFNTILNDETGPDKHHLLTESIKHRVNCDHISIRNYALCKCLTNVTFPNKEDDRYKEFVIWLGEFAVGHLNNKLASQLITSKAGHRCSRIQANNQGNTIRNIIERRASRGTIYSFDVLTKRDESIDVFNFQILFNEKRNEKIELVQIEHWIRISIYSRYASCKDKNVSYELCVCSDDKREKIDKEYISNYRQFETLTENIPLLNRTCAFLLKRTNLYVVTYEIANMCQKKVKIEFSTKVKYSWVASQSLPIEASVKPNTIQFLVTFIKVVESSEDLKPSIIIRK